MGIIEKRYGATDGLIKMPDGTSHYIFGFVDITNVPEDQIFEYRGKAILLAPLLEAYEGDEIKLTLTNLGLVDRPDLDDTHTIHYHGFPNQIPLWDGVPELSISVPVGRDFVYYYKPLNPGTYMYHCHFEPVEHIQMGMIGPLVIRPQLDKTLGKTFAYNDPATEFDHEIFIFLTELDSRIHYLIKNAQELDWTDYSPDYWLIDGRSYPDSVKPNHDPSLPQQPFSSLVTANQGEKVLLRFINLGFQQHCIEILGIPLQVIGLDANQPRYNGNPLSYWKNAIYIGAGQTIDALITAPRPGTYPLYNRNLNKDTIAGKSFGGMVSEIKVLASP